MKLLLTILLCLSSSAAFAQTNCLQTANEIRPRLSAETQREFETKLDEARELFERDSHSADSTIWLGRRTAYLGRYKDVTLRRLGHEKEASKTLVAIKDNLDLIENTDYYKMIRIYKGEFKAASVWTEINSAADSLSNATIGYGLGNWFLYNGQRAQAEKVFRQVTAGNQWSSFGYIAAESDLKRLSKSR